MSTDQTYLAVFTSSKSGPRWRAWYAMSEDERRARNEEGLAALTAWDEAHRDAIVYEGGPLGPTKRTSAEGVADVINELTVLRRRPRAVTRGRGEDVRRASALHHLPVRRGGGDAAAGAEAGGVGARFGAEMARARGRAGIIREQRRIGWHDLRHTYGSHLAMKGVPLKIIQELIGGAGAG